MFTHVTLGADDVGRAAAFYDAFFAPLGVTRLQTADDGSFVAWARNGDPPHLFVGKPFDGAPASPGNGAMIAVEAPNRGAVIAAWQAGLAHGGTDEGAPALRPRYGPDYFGAYLRDPAGNKVHTRHRGGPAHEP